VVAGGDPEGHDQAVEPAEAGEHAGEEVGDVGVVGAICCERLARVAFPRDQLDGVLGGGVDVGDGDALPLPPGGRAASMSTPRS
jgi:hypothetical protein